MSPSRKWPTKLPMTPMMMLTSTPLPLPLTILLPKKPATRPMMIVMMMFIVVRMNLVKRW